MRPAPLGHVPQRRRAQDANASDAGAAYLVYGPAAGVIDLATDSSVTFSGIATADYSGSLPSGRADLDGDGLDDIVVGARQADNAGASDNGAVYLIFGVEAGF